MATIEAKLGFLGAGNMGMAIIAGLVSTGAAEPGHIHVFDPEPAKQDAVKALGCKAAATSVELAAGCDILVLAVKPQNMSEALEPLKATLSSEALVVSIMAGISIDCLQNELGAQMRVVRCMPNLPALSGAGAAGVALSVNCTDADKGVAAAIFEAVGVVEFVPETALDTVTALSGSGPAYFFYLTECMAKAAVAQGLPESQALNLAAQTLIGAGALLRDSGESASTLRQRVTSKGGTTAAALSAFEAEGFERLVQAGMDAAAARSRELGR
ncbi:MAG: pyrroline-5-carboxylate reductase [Candidatus Hydrogenedentes bacterium]|nr:pyrroline-5-carboxylate reductase [Candidatus Hydrogenedentota bacterium]